MAYIGKEPLAGNFVKLDAITTSATATYALTRNSVAFKPANAESLLVSLNGVTQAPLDAYTVNDTNIVFASALTSSDTIDYILALGEIGAVTTPADSTVDTPKLTTGAVTAAKLATDSVTTIKIADDAVTGAKIENNPTIAGNLTVSGTSALTGDATVSRNEANGTVRLTLSNTGVNGSTEYSELKLNSTAGGTQTSVVQHRNNYGLNIGTTTNHAVYLLQNNATALTIDTSKNVKLPNDAGDFTFTTNSLHIGASADIKIGHTNNNNVILSDNGMPFNIYTDVFRVNSADNSENLFGADKNDAFFAKFDNVTKLQTYSQGLQVNGNIRTGNSGDRAIIGRAPITGTTVNNGSTTTVAGVNGVLHNIVIVSDGGGSGGCFAMSYNTGVTKLAGSGNYTSSQNTSSSTNIYKSSNSHAVTLQNNTGSDRSYFILVLASYD